MLSQKRRSASPSEDGFQLETQREVFTIDGYLLPILRSKHGHQIMFYASVSIILTFPSKGRVEGEQRKNKILLGTILSE